ncbi:MAG: glycine oxidase ThiO [Planctomycetes bacterium]|nr:glycine oxidase ThiO [Planctomycetota bacterium]
MSLTADVAIVGAGIVGCCTAYELSRAGANCLLVDAQEAGREASWASAGVITHPPPGRGPYARLRRLGHEAFGPFAEELQAQTSIDIGYHRTGSLEPYFTEEEEAEALRMETRLRSDGLPVQRLSAGEARAIEPGLAEDLRGALFQENDHQVRNPRFLRALAESAVRKGTRLLLHHRVIRLLRGDSGIFGLETATETVHATTVVLAAGAWSRALADTAGLNLKVEPVKGQIVQFEGPSGLLRHIVHGADVYCVPRADGLVLVGATVEQAGFDKRVTLQGMHDLLGSALRIFPGLRGLPMVGAWAGLRPYAARPGGPFLGPAPGLPGLVIATGHYRNGILLAPITGRLVRELILDGKTSMPLDPFRVDR